MRETEYFAPRGGVRPRLSDAGLDPLAELRSIMTKT